MFMDNLASYRFSSNRVENENIPRINPFFREPREENPALNPASQRLQNNLIVEDHFYEPIIVPESSSIEQLTIAIRDCKQKVLKLMDNEDAKNRQISELVELNEKLHTRKELAKTENDSRTINNIINGSPGTANYTQPIDLIGHHLVRSRKGLADQRYCETCRNPMRAVLAMYQCSSCTIYVHASRPCLEKLHRACPASNLGHPSMFQSQIISSKRYSSAQSDLYIEIEHFPLCGNLVSQKFLCAECSYPLRPVSSQFLINSRKSPALFCNYFHKFYCSSCHWGNKYWVPAVFFMLNQWTKLGVCRSAYLKLKYMWNSVLFRQPVFWEKNNSKSSEVLMIRLKMFRLRSFIRYCSVMKNLTLSYDDWLIEQPYLVTMGFVQKISEGSASVSVQFLYSSLLDHISDCETCKGLCRPCPLCNDKEPLYPKPVSTWSCSKCYISTIHESCGIENGVTESDFICEQCIPR